MAAYPLGVAPLIHNLLEITSSNKLYSKEIAYTDDFTVAGSVKDIKCFWEHLNSFASFFGYYPIVSKSHLNIGIRHLGVVIGNHLYNEKICK